MPYKVYIDVKLVIGGKPKWSILEALPQSGSYFTRAEADAQAKHNLAWWRKRRKGHPKYRARIVKVKR